MVLHFSAAGSYKLSSGVLTLYLRVLFISSRCYISHQGSNTFPREICASPSGAYTCPQGSYTSLPGSFTSPHSLGHPMGGLTNLLGESCPTSSGLSSTKVISGIVRISHVFVRPFIYIIGILFVLSLSVFRIPLNITTLPVVHTQCWPVPGYLFPGGLF
jgi:hypothetical protein